MIPATKAIAQNFEHVHSDTTPLQVDIKKKPVQSNYSSSSNFDSLLVSKTNTYIQQKILPLQSNYSSSFNYNITA
jgi:hypothetical protein